MKTKLGISVAMLAAGTYLIGFFAGYVALLLIAGYVLICESDEWLKKAVVKALVVTVAFSLISAIIGLIPNAISLVDSLCSIFDGHFSILFVSRFINFINVVLSVFEKLLMLAFAFLALDGKTIKLPVIDDFIEKHL